MQLMQEELERIKEGILIKRLKTIIWLLKRTKKGQPVQNKELAFRIKWALRDLLQL